MIINEKSRQTDDALGDDIPASFATPTTSTNPPKPRIPNGNLLLPLTAIRPEQEAVPAATLSATGVAPPTTTVAPTTTTGAPSPTPSLPIINALIRENVPTSTISAAGVAPPTTTVAPTTTSAAPPVAPPTTTVAPTTTSAAPSPTPSLPIINALIQENVPASTISAAGVAPPTTTVAPTTTSAAPPDFPLISTPPLPVLNALIQETVPTGVAPPTTTAAPHTLDLNTPVTTLNSSYHAFNSLPPFPSFPRFSTVPIGTTLPPFTSLAPEAITTTTSTLPPFTSLAPQAITTTTSPLVSSQPSLPSISQTRASLVSLPTNDVLNRLIENSYDGKVTWQCSFRFGPYQQQSPPPITNLRDLFFAIWDYCAQNLRVSVPILVAILGLLGYAYTNYPSQVLGVAGVVRAPATANSAPSPAPSFSNG